MLEFIKTHYDEVLAIFGAAVLIISTVTKLTATEKDDEIWAKVLKVLSALSLVNPDGSVIGKGEDKQCGQK